MKLKDLDISKIERPVLMKKPEKPKKPDPYLEKTKTDKNVFWSSAAVKNFHLLDVLKNVPKEINLDDVQIWSEAKMTGSVYDYNKKASSTIFIGTIKDNPNPKYVTAQTKYEAELGEYNEKIAKWEADQADYDSKMELYKKFKDLVDAKDQKASLMKKLASLSVKESIKVVPIAK